MIVVIGTPRAATPLDGVALAAGRAVAIAEAAARAGATVEFAGRIGDDAMADAVVLDLARRGIGHAALLRIGGLPVASAPTADDVPGPAAADVDLALRYLTGYAVVVAAEELEPAALDAAMEAAAWCDAHLIVVSRYEGPPTGLPDASTVLQPPAPRPAAGDGGDGEVDDVDEGAFAVFVGSYAAAIDRGDDPAAAFAALETAFASERVG